MQLKFKTPLIESQWNDPKLDDRVKAVVEMIAGYCYYTYRHIPTITSVWRPVDANKPTSPHPHWRAVDIRTHDMPKGCPEAIVEEFNYLLTYDRTRDWLKVVLYHTVSGKPEDLHLHVQVVDVSMRGNHEAV